jgi:hypothetical protein
VLACRVLGPRSAAAGEEDDAGAGLLEWAQGAAALLAVAHS